MEVGSSILLIVLAVIAFVLLGFALAGLFVSIVWHVFHLQDLIHISYWQSIGIGVLIGGAGTGGVLSFATRTT